MPIQITEKNWLNYLRALEKINEGAAEKVTDYLSEHEILSEEGRKNFLDYFYAIVTKYGEGSAEMACQMYDATAKAQGANVPPAEPAPTATYPETARAVNGSLFDSPSGAKLPGTAKRLVKQAGVDTTMKNAIRDGAEWAWVPHGDTCAFCLMMASNGWQRASKNALKKGHAQHIHGNCDCTYAVRFDGKSGVKGYDPNEYKALYDNAEGDNWREKMNSMRREHYAENKDRINEQKRVAYAKRRTSDNHNKGPVTASYNSPKIFNTDEIVEGFLNNIELPNDPIVIEKVRNSVKHMPKEDLDYLQAQGIIVKKTKGASSFIRTRRKKGKDGKLKYIIQINQETDEPFVFAHECAHLAEKANNLYSDPEFKKILENFNNTITEVLIGETDGDFYAIGRSPLLVEPYQGRTYVKYLGRQGFERELTAEDYVEYISSGYECYIGDPKLLETKDQKLYNYFEKRGLR